MDPEDWDFANIYVVVDTLVSNWLQENFLADAEARRQIIIDF